MEYIIAYLLLINAVGLLLMLMDKRKAQNNRWRIRESTLMCAAVAGGTIGVFIGMRCFRHKTKHSKFYLGIPIILTVQILIAIYFLTLQV